MPARLLFRRLVDLIERGEVHVRVLVGEHLGDRRRQRRLAVVDVTDRPDVQVRLVALELLLGHGCTLLLVRRSVMQCVVRSFAADSGDDLLRDRLRALAGTSRTASCRSRAPGCANEGRQHTRTSAPTAPCALITCARAALLHALDLTAP